MTQATFSDSASTLFINGAWEPAASGAVREIRNPADGELVATVSEAGREDAERAIAAARAAFDSGVWASVPAPERGTFLLKVAAGTARTPGKIRPRRIPGHRQAHGRKPHRHGRHRRLLRILRTGSPGSQAGRVVDAGDPAVVSKIVYEPVGVCGLITPWNYPLLQAAWKIAPALAAGCTFVLKPSELTPSTAILAMQLLQDLGLPDGVANLVTGAGAEAGAPLSEHPDVDLVSFTGGLETGKRIAAAAAGTVKKVALELGGKNPNVVFADADFDAAVDNALNGAFVHSGQVCSAGARLVVEESIAERFVDELVRRAQGIRHRRPVR